MEGRRGLRGLGRSTGLTTEPVYKECLCYAQILTDLRMSPIRIGLLMNFHALRLRDGLRRFVV